MKIPIRTSILLIGINGILAFDFLIENGQTTFASNVEVKDFQFVTNFDITGTTLDKLVTTCTNILLKNSINCSLQNKSIIVSLDG